MGSFTALREVTKLGSGKCYEGNTMEFSLKGFDKWLILLQRETLLENLSIEPVTWCKVVAAIIRKKITSNFLEKWEVERLYFNSSHIINSFRFQSISVISKHSCTVQMPVLAQGASEKVPRCAKTVTLRSAGDLFGSVSCIPSRFSRLWKWMFSILMADFCMHLFTHLNLSYMLLWEWKAIIFSLEIGIVSCTTISA